MRKRYGDTLVEVALAIGIFSMVAISIVSVISGSTADAQEALEVSLTREEIDIQAEALRFIHSSYSNSKSTGNTSGKYESLWNEIVEGAGNTAPDTNTPSTCQDQYASPSNEENKLISSRAFIINPRNLNLPVDQSLQYRNNIKKIVVKATDDNLGTIFKEAITYPHLIYQDARPEGSANPSQDSQQSEDYINDNYLEESDLYSAQGIYIIPVKGYAKSESGSFGSTTIYYDFFIRTCWYGVGNDQPSTISTVVRLYDPSTLSGN